jgi:toxin ParE1/3/4
MDFKIIWSDGALDDLHHICRFIAQDNPEAAIRVGDGVVSHVEVLASFPFIGPRYPRAGGPLREIVYGRYRIFYEVSETDRIVRILHVWHGSREEPLFGLD